ncbi:adenosine deaminase [Oxalobacteraceae bacterium]|nr:adenosine deaminase [Oxalobacteraceae bacterium]
MHKKIASLLVTAALSAGLPQAAHAASNETITKRYFAALVGSEPRLAELTMFFTLMPKGGDLHHHYSGAIYAEQFLEWVDKQNYCVDSTALTIQAMPPAGACVSGASVMNNNALLAQVLQRWSDKDFYNHGALQSPPDRQFFDTFGYFGPVASTNTADGLQRLKQRAIQENVSYLETIFELAPMVLNADFDKQAASGVNDAMLTAFSEQLDKNQDFKKGIDAYLANVNTSGAGIDDDKFTLRYQSFVLRFLSPSQVFSTMLASFKLASMDSKIVGVNIVGQESVNVSMRDYAMHMQMFKYLKARYPKVKLALHAGELALGLVPPEGLSFHIRDAIDVAGAQRIGHGIDIAHETNPIGIMKKMREQNIAVEVNLSSNDFILGIKDQAHPVTLYRKYGVPFVISTDDAGVSRNNLSGEYVLFASRYKTNYAEVKKLSYDSLRYSFLAQDDKDRLIKALDGKFARFEADIAAGEARKGK